MANVGLNVDQSRTYAVFAAIGRWLKVFAAWCAACARRSKERRKLARLDERMLKDIGISRLDALREANRPFWDVGLEKNSILPPPRARR